MGGKLDNLPTELWEQHFLNFVKNDAAAFQAIFPQIEYVLVDEFQDITNPRLETLFAIHNLFPDAKFFTIGDINQSIYGFDRVPKDNWGRPISLTPEQYAQVLNPQPYYDRLNNALAPVQLGMFTNYRSYQKILDCAAIFIPEERKHNLPKSSAELMKMSHKSHIQYSQMLARQVHHGMKICLHLLPMYCKIMKRLR